MCFWSKMHCLRVLAWDAHCRRPRNSASWASKLIDFRAKQWLDNRRAACQRGTESRLDSRVCRGAPAQRWHEGVEFARVSA